MKILITGSNGTIGSVLRSNISHDTTDFDLPEHDVRDLEQLKEALHGHDVVIHLAWDTVSDNFRSDYHNIENTQQVLNVYNAADAAGVRRVIMASSVHADKFTNRKLQGPLDPYALPYPDSPYGAGKCMMEALGRYFANAKNLEVVCIRFGGVNPSNTKPSDPYSESQVWLSHEDCVSLVTKCVETDNLPGNYAIVYAVSDNKDRIHDTRNPFGWKPTSYK